jgi:hypothetical protein
MKSTHDADGRRLPIKLDSTSNGEYEPIPLEPVHREARHEAMVAATANAGRLGLKRRQFLVSACGAATALLGMNTAYARAGRTGGYYDVPQLAALEDEVARSVVNGGEFIFDVQGHFVNPTGAWLKQLEPGSRPLRFATDDPRCKPHDGPGDFDYLRCVGPEQFVKDVFLDSDTDLMVLSFVPSTAAGEPLKIEEAEATAQIVERLEGNAPAVPARARESESAWRSRPHGRTRAKAQGCGIQDVHPVGAGREGLLA